jgi:hypothetical protein
MNPIAPALARPAGRAVLLGVACLLAAPAPAPAQDAKVRLLFSYFPDASLAAPTFYLRPNVPQELFLFVKNEDNKDRVVTVELLADGAVVLSQKVPVAQGKTAPVQFARPTTPPGTPPPPPAFTEAGKAAFRLVDETGKASDPVPVDIASPTRYVEAPLVRYYPRAEGNPTNRLAVTVRVREKFAGPPARVDLVLDRDRIPALEPKQVQRGVYGGLLPGDGSQTLSLVAEDLRFSVPTSKGLVVLTVDGYKRAFTFDVTFARDRTTGAPVDVTSRGLALDVPVAAPPQMPVKVGIEVDNLPPNARAKLDVLTQKLQEVKADQFELRPEFNEVAEFARSRRERLFVSAAGPRGGVLLRGEVRDWDTEVDLSGIHGATVLRLRMVQAKRGEEAKEEILKVRENRTNEPAERPDVRRDLTLDDKPPAGVRFVALPAAVRAGQVFTALATSSDPAANLAGVNFYLAKLQPGDKLPEDAVALPARLVDVEKELWGVEIQVPRTQATPLDITVKFVKKNKLAVAKSAQIDLAVGDLPAAAGPKQKASITGKVVEGGRPQRNVSVALQDPTGQAKGSTLTNANGQFEVKGLDPGTYRLIAVKTADNTRGEITVQLGEGEQRVLKPEESIKLFRR